MMATAALTACSSVSEPPPPPPVPDELPLPPDSTGIIDIPFDLEPQAGLVHRPFLEWEVQASDYDGDPFDVRAYAHFTHTSGDSYRVPLYFAGDDTWRFRFTAPRTGTYLVETESELESFDALTTRATFAADPDPAAHGFLVAEDGAFTVLVGDGTESRRILYNVYQRHNSKRAPAGVETPAHYSADPAVRGPHIEALLDETQAHGMNATFLLVGSNWLQHGNEYNEWSTNEHPDDVTFEIIEDVLERTRARGMFLHIWMWADEENRNAAPLLRGGTNGPIDERLQYYIMGRLGAFPNWTLSLGYDLEEWVTPAEARRWRETMVGFNDLPRLFMARETQDGASGSNRFSLGSDKLDVFSVDQRPRSDFFADARTMIERADGRPVLYERRFLHTRDDVWDMATTRRALWQFTIAGGAGGVWGVLWGNGEPYPSPESLRTLETFWRERFAVAYEPAVVLDGRASFALHAQDGASSVYYAEAARSVPLGPEVGDGVTRAVAIDTRRPYEEIEIDLGSSDASWQAPHRSDWVLAVDRDAR